MEEVTSEEGEMIGYEPGKSFTLLRRKEINEEEGSKEKATAYRVRLWSCIVAGI